MSEAEKNAPRPSAWPGHSLAKRRIVRRLGDELRRRQDGVAATIRGVERELRDEANRIRGRFDRVEESDAGVTVVDLKSGGAEMSESHRRQLMIYAHLWKVETGELVAQGVIESLNGDRVSTVMDESEVAALVRLAITERDRINGLVAREAAAGELAAPSPDSCRWCERRAWCDPFWGALAEEWDHRASLAGTVVAVSPADARREVTLELVAGNIDLQEANVLDVPQLPDVGASVFVTDVVPAHTELHFRCVRESTFAVR